MLTDEQAYFYARAEQELGMAEKAILPEAVAAHYQLANRYLAEVERSGEIPKRRGIFADDVR